jgi:hypothetical protein
MVLEEGKTGRGEDGRAERRERRGERGEGRGERGEGRGEKEKGIKNASPGALLTWQCRVRGRKKEKKN